MIDLKKIADEIAIGKAGSVDSWSLPISDVEQMLDLIYKQEGELSAARKANDILLEQSNSQISEIYTLETALAEIQGRMGALILAQEATVKESLNVAGELPLLPAKAYLGGDEAFGDVITGYTDECMHDYGRACIAAARPAIWYEGCDTALAHGPKVAPAVDLSGLTAYEFKKFPTSEAILFYEASDVRALLAAAPVAPTAPTDISVRLRALRSFGPEHFELLVQAADEIDRYYGAMLAWKQAAETKDRKLSEEMCARVDERVAARIAEGNPLTQAQIDHIGEQWDGCSYDGVDDIGAALRFELAKIGGVK